MSGHFKYDVAIIGGGLAGLTCAISLANMNYSVVLFEKEVYPFHKVCGEYISFESFDLLRLLGVKLEDHQLPSIHHLMLSAPSGNWLSHQLPLGGFGISRFKIDSKLASIAKTSGVELLDGTKVINVIQGGDLSEIITNGKTYYARVVCGAFGKRSNLDVKMNRRFMSNKPGPLNNYIGVKYHAALDNRRDTIELHNFENGYCGVSPIEDNKFCICYLTTAGNLRNHGNNIRRMEVETLSKNPFLNNLFNSAGILYDRPLTISQISFEKKELVCNRMLMLGDAASLIAPLCGNGMSMAMKSGSLATMYISKYLEKQISRDELESYYAREWLKTFSRRLRAGRIIQPLFGRPSITNATISSLRHLPKLLNWIIRQTHG